MRLGEFIRSSLAQIAEGVVTGKALAAAYGVAVAPVCKPTATGTLAAAQKDRGEDMAVQTVHFDIAVTATRQNGSEGGGIEVAGGLFGFSASLGSGKKTKGQENSQVSRISFDVPIAFPGTRPPSKRQS